MTDALGAEARELLAALKAAGIDVTPRSPHRVEQVPRSESLRALWRGTGMRTMLLAQGLTEQDVFGPQPAGEVRHVRYLYDLGSERLALDEFPGEEAAAEYAYRLTPDGAAHRGPGPLVTQHELPSPRLPLHWFRLGRLLVLYEGSSATVLALLQQRCGAQIAGATGSAAT